MGHSKVSQEETSFKLKQKKKSSVGDVRKQVGHWLAIVGTSDSLGKHHRDIYHLEEWWNKMNKLKLKLPPHPLLAHVDLLAWILGHSFMWRSWGIELVTTTASKHALLIREIAGPEKIPWVSMA